MGTGPFQNLFYRDYNSKKQGHSALWRSSAVRHSSAGHPGLKKHGVISLGVMVLKVKSASAQKYTHRRTKSRANSGALMELVWIRKQTRMLEAAKKN